MSISNQTLSAVKNFLLFSLLVFLLALLSLNVGYSGAVLNGIYLWFYSVLPTLFPYVFVVGLIQKLNLTNGINKLFNPLSKKLFNVNGSVFSAFILSLLSGYPIGAKTVSDLKNGNLISNAEAERASVICSTSSPSFLIATVGGLFFKNRVIGLIILLSQIFTQFLIGCIFKFYKKNEKATPLSLPLTATNNNLLYDNVYSSVISVLVVGGMITVFYLLGQVLISLKILSPLTFTLSKIIKSESLANGVSLGIIEVTGGLKEISYQGVSPLTVSLSSMLCGFGGISVILQSVAFLKNAKIKIAPFVFSKLLSAIFNFLFSFIFCLIFL